mgnify:CR=1 FL=1
MEKTRGLLVNEEYLLGKGFIAPFVEPKAFIDHNLLNFGAHRMSEKMCAQGKTSTQGKLTRKGKIHIHGCLDAFMRGAWAFPKCSLITRRMKRTKKTQNTHNMFTFRSGRIPFIVVRGEAHYIKRSHIPSFNGEYLP